MTLTILDHVFGLVLALYLPLGGAWQYRRLRGRLASGESQARVRHYRSILLEEIVLTALVLGLWLGYDRPWALLAPAVPIGWSWLPWVGWGATTAFVVLLVVQARMLGRTQEGVDQTRQHLEAVSEMLPRTAEELRSVRALSLAAGIGEEVVFRGFAMAWLTVVASGAMGLGAGAALAAAVLGSSVLFGLAHTYQGASGVVKTGSLGLLFAGLALATGGLLAPMLAHTVMDLASSGLAFKVLQEPATAAA